MVADQCRPLVLVVPCLPYRQEVRLDQCILVRLDHPYHLLALSALVALVGPAHHHALLPPAALVNRPYHVAQPALDVL